MSAPASAHQIQPLQRGTMPAALRPTARAMEHLPGAIAALTAVTLVGYGLLTKPDLPLHGHLPNLRLAMLALAAGAGFTFDDPAEATLAPCAASLVRRRGQRLSLALGSWALGWVMVLGMTSAMAPGRLPVGLLSVEAFGWLTLSLAASASLSGAATGTTLLVLFVVAHQLPARLTLMAVPGSWWGAPTRWAPLVVAAVSLTLWSSRDPARRSPRLRGRPARQVHSWRA